MLNFLIINCRYTGKLFRGSNKIDISNKEDKKHNVLKYSHNSKDYADFASHHIYLGEDHISAEQSQIF